MLPESTETSAATASWRRWLYASFLASLALSAYKAGSASTINNDGLLYLHTAQVFVEQGARAAFAQFNWPAFPILVGLLQHATGLAYESAAYAINALLLAFLSAGFVAFYRELSDGRGRPWIAAAVVLVSPQLADYRAYIVRDIGYWALSLWAILYFVRYCRRQRGYHALAWQACIAGAIAFRIEAAALAALLPLWCLWAPASGTKQPQLRRIRAWLGANSLFLLAAAGAAVLWAASSAPWAANSRLEQLAQFLSPAHIGAQFAGKAEALARHAQVFYAPQDARLVLLGGVCYLFVHKIVAGLGMVYAPLLAWGWLKKPALLGRCPLLWFAAGISAIPLLAFAFNDLFLSGRYMGLLVLLLSLPVAMAAEALLFDAGQDLRRPRWAAVLALAALALLLDALVQTGPSKRYLREAGDWLHGHLPAGTSLCSEDSALLYYAGRGYGIPPCPALQQLEQTEQQPYGAYLIKLGRKDADKRRRLEALLRERGDLQNAAQFGNAAGDRLYVITHAPSRP